MQVDRVEREGYTDITIYGDDRYPWSAHRVTCLDVETDDDGKRQPPKVYISVLTLRPGASVESLRRLAAEYMYVADIAEKLQAEKQEAYRLRFGDT